MARARLKNLGLLAGLVALGAAGWWSLRGARGTHGEQTAAPRVEESTEQRSEAVIAAPATGAPERVAAEAVEREEVALESAPAPLTGNTEVPGKIAISGTIVVTGPDGVEHPSESGSMKVLAWRGDTGVHQPVDIVEGRWTATVAEDVSLSFNDIALGGRLAVSEHEEHLAIPASGLLAVRARWPRESVLHVRSAQTHAELAGIEIVRASGWGAGQPRHPGSYRERDVLVSEATSPIDLGRAFAGKRPGRLFARAEGYAWGMIDVDLDMGGERFLDLVPGGDLNILLVGTVPADATLRLRDAAEKLSGPVLEIDLRGRRELQLTSLAPGQRSVSIEIGDWYAHPVVLGSTLVEVIEGGVAQVSLDVVPPAAVATAALKGVLVLDPAWGEIAPGLSVELVGTPEDGREVRKNAPSGSLRPVAGVVDTWEFDFGSVPHGNYEFEVNPPFCLLGRSIDGATGDVRLEVPAPADVEVRVVDGAGLEVTDLTTLLWNPTRPSGVMGGSLQSVTRNSATGGFELRAPSGAVHLSVIDVRFRGAETFDLVPGHQAVDLVVTRTVGFALSLRDGETLLPWPDDWYVQAEEVDGDGTSHGWSQDVHGMRIAVTSPGIYRFTLPNLPGYEPIPEQEVVVPEQGFTEHVVELVRSP